MLAKLLSATAITGLAAGLALSAASAAEFDLRLHTLVSDPHPYNDMAAAMKAKLEAESDERITLRIFDAGQLGQDPAVIGEIGLGTIDLMISSTNNAAKQVPEYQILSMPYLFADMDEMAETLGPDSAVKAHFEEVYEARGVGMKLLALTGSGTRNLSTAEGPVESLADIEGIRMRTPPSPLDSQTWEALGTLPVSVAWGELYAAMQTGVAEGLESSLPGYKGSKLYEVAPYLALTAHTIQGTHISMSQRSWDKLPEDLQTLVQEAANEAATLGIEKAKGYDADLVSQLETENGVTVTRPDITAFQEALAPKQAELAAELDLEEELALIRQ